MSRIGKKPVSVPAGVTASLDGQIVKAKGPKGELTFTVPTLVSVSLDTGSVKVQPRDESKPARAQWGMSRTMVSNIFSGVTKGFEKKLEINGVGYKAEIKGPKIVLSLGYSHPIEYQLPEGISAKVDKNLLILSGIDRQALGAATAKIRSFRPPEPYKGKGIKYIEETILRKAGKTAGK
jgi:large subunit ribosomal protein L6